MPEPNESVENGSAENEPAAEQQAENVGLSTLTHLGNEAVALGLIAGHGHHQGKYEIIHNGEIITVSSGEAVTYLQDLIQSAKRA